MTENNSYKGVVEGAASATPERGRDSQCPFELLARYINHSPLGIIEWDNRFRVVRWSNRAEAIFGWSEYEVLGKHPDDWPFIHPEDRSTTDDVMQSLLDGVTSRRTCLNRNLTKDGSIIYCEWYHSVVSANDGQPVSIVSLVQDVTRVVHPDGWQADRPHVDVPIDSQAEQIGTDVILRARELQQLNEQLRENELMLKMAGELAHLGAWTVDLARNNKVTLSDEVCAIHDQPPGYSPTVEEGINLYAPEHRERIQKAFEACATEGTPFDEVLKLITVKGRHVWIRTIGQAVRDAHGRIVKIHGAYQDITEQKLAQQEAERLDNQLLLTLESMSDAFFTLDREWRFTYVNKEAERLLHNTREDLIGKVVWEVYPLAAKMAFYDQYHHAMSEQRVVEFEEYYPPFDIWYDVKAFPSEDSLAVYFRDIKERKAVEKALQLSEERFRIIARATADAVWDWDMQTGQMWWNEGIQTLFGYAPEDIESDISSWTNRLHPDEKDRILDEVNHSIESGAESWTSEYRFRRKDGSYAYVWDRSFIIRDESGKAIRMVGGKNDITESKLQQEKLEQQAQLLDKAHDAIIVRDIDNRVLFWNKGAERLYGWTSEEVLGQVIEDNLYEDPSAFRQATQELLKSGEWRGELKSKRKDGTNLVVEAHWTLMFDSSGAPHSILAINTDITQRKAAEKEIQYLAFYDPLTKLPNRQLLMDRLTRAIAASARNKQHGALLFIDLDNFKILNDTLGHDIGDLLLQQVAQRLSACIRETDSVARLGGDEFVVMLENLGEHPLDAAGQVESVAMKILKTLNQPYRLGDYDHHSTPSIGITLFNNLQQGIDELLKRADIAMYRAKEEGKNTIRFFDPEMQAAVTARITLESDLRRGLKQDEFLLYYQPQINSEGSVIGAEALLRWRNPGRGLVSPAEFIPLAEDTGLILPIGQRVLELACTQLVAWAARPETAGLNLSVNVSARQFHHRDFVEQVLTVLEQTGADPSKLMLELTESLLVDDMESTIEKMTALKSAGVSFSLDDFGTGYSSLTYLKRLPLNLLKIDRSFVQDVLVDPNDEAIIRTIIALGQSLGLAIIAEGVETASQRDFLARLGCLAYQGYLFSYPLPAEEFEMFMYEHKVS